MMLLVRALIVFRVIAATNAHESWAFLPTEPGVYTADPIARVFNDRLYVYTSWDSNSTCGARATRAAQGYQQFCMSGYRAYSTNDADLGDGWVNHGVMLNESSVPWVYRGDEGWISSARMWAPEVIQADDKLYYMFFPAPYGRMDDMRIGVAVSTTPTGEFVARSKPIIGSVRGIDPSVVRLHNGVWVIFESGDGELWVSRLNSDFTKSTARVQLSGLKKGYKEGPYAEIHNSTLHLYYSHSTPGRYTIEQAEAFDAAHPEWGFIQLSAAVSMFDGRTNHASLVWFRRKRWIFYHLHMETQRGRWATRRVVYSPAQADRYGWTRTIKPFLRNRRFFVTLPSIVDICNHDCGVVRRCYPRYTPKYQFMRQCFRCTPLLEPLSS